jgi:hypothetical protein
VTEALTADERVIGADSGSTCFEVGPNFAGEPGIVFVKMKDLDSPDKKCLQLLHVFLDPRALEYSVPKFVKHNGRDQQG